MAPGRRKKNPTPGSNAHGTNPGGPPGIPRRTSHVPATLHSIPAIKWEQRRYNSTLRILSPLRPPAPWPQTSRRKNSSRSGTKKTPSTGRGPSLRSQMLARAAARSVGRDTSRAHSRRRGHLLLRQFPRPAEQKGAPAHARGARHLGHDVRTHPNSMTH